MQPSSPPAGPPVEPTHARLTGSGITARLWPDVRLEVVFPVGKDAEWVTLALQTLVGPGWQLVGAEKTDDGLMFAWTPPGSPAVPTSRFDDFGALST